MLADRHPNVDHIKAFYQEKVIIFSISNIVIHCLHVWIGRAINIISFVREANYVFNRQVNYIQTKIEILVLCGLLIFMILKPADPQTPDSPTRR